MRRLLLLIVVLILLLAILGIGVGLSLSQDGPFQPGDALFPYQYLAEQERLSLIANPTERVIFLAHLAGVRADDLILLAGTPGEELALDYLSRAFDQVLQALRSMPADELPVLQEYLIEMAGKIDIALSASLVSNPTLADLQASFAAFRGLLAAYNPENSPASNPLGLSLARPPNGNNPDSGANSPGMQLIDPHAVSFPPGSSGAAHAFFPLTGRHAALPCEDCHTQGRYAGTANQCAACHANVKPASHYAGDCASCHTTASWRQAQFNHSLAIANDCQSCHTRDKPANHFPGQCSSCHNTDAWNPARFNHQAAGATNCTSCHSGDKPANHFTGQCSSCHNTDAWRPASFNHQAAGATNCASCHSGDKPANHFTGQCSSCHNTDAWRPAHFNHQAAGATDCASCHNRPSNHYAGQCSSCHNTDAWRPARFNHQAAGATDCSGCHNRPSNHYAGQCSGCHNTDAWRPARFNHQAAGATDCAGCHNRPSNHYAGQCSQCHTTDNWRDVRLEGHSFPLNHGGARGNCSRCHSGETNSVNCYTCHDQQKMEKHHAEKNILDIAGRCLECHPDGKKD
ncbi:MAG: hypothetical protein A2W36_02160 [Chloroflexi bacterium RBG_16_58_14]|nr:MAG: hypothetical protein A2W36_02160 [Chloroflexi bacterium RBG_16_58_14]